MADALTYAKWLDANADKKGTEEFDTVAEAFRLAAKNEGAPPSMWEKVKDRAEFAARATAQRAGDMIPGSAAEVVASVPGSLVTGVAEVPVGVVQLGADAAGAAYKGITGNNPVVSTIIRNAIRDFEAFRESGNPTLAADLARLGGNAVVGGGVASRVPQAQTFIGRILTAMGIGAAEGAALPVTSESPWAERGAQAGTGAVFGGGASVLGDAARLGAERWTNRGRQTVQGRMLREAAGERTPQVVAALRANQNPVSQGSAGQVAVPAGSAEFSALQRSLENRLPSEYRDLEVRQNQARVAEIDNFAGDVSDIERAKRARDSAANPLYTQARNSTVLVDPRRTVNLIDRILTERISNDASGVANVVKNVRDTLYEFYPAQQRAKDSWDYVRQAIATQQARTARIPEELVQARKILNDVKNFNIDEFTGAERLKALRGSNALATDALSKAYKSLILPDYVVTQSPSNLINASRSISRLLDSRSGDGDVARTVRSELLTIKRSLDTQIGKLVPEYKAARTTFADLSRPIDEMEIGAYLRDKLVPALDDAGASGSQRAQVFAGAVRDAPGTISRATGYRREPRLEAILNPQAISAIQRVGADLARMAEYEALAARGAQRAALVLGEAYSERAPAMIDRGITYLNEIAKRTGMSAKDRTLGELAKTMMDPAKTADLLEKATASERFNLGRIFQGAVATTAAQGASNATNSVMEAQQ